MTEVGPKVGVDVMGGAVDVGVELGGLAECDEDDDMSEDDGVDGDDDVCEVDACEVDA